jgi:N6-L-threonylcarbamoyladenine synthase
MLVLGIETSCDDTSAALVADGRQMLANVFSSQVAIHKPFGGVVPELASRSHLETLPGTVDAALEKAGKRLADVDAVAVTYGPGLVGALLVGLMAGKSLAMSLGKPLIGVNHLQAHLAACFIADPSLSPPFLGLVVSGGHTALVEVAAVDSFRLIGQTRDDAAGEVLDKVGRLMGLPFPAGKYIEEEARRGDAAAVKIPRPTLGENLEFSFSGLKTAVSQLARAGKHRREDLCAGLQGAIVDVLAVKAAQALERTKLPVLALAGGVAANGPLRARLRDVAEAAGARFVVPSNLLCTDNAAMVAALGGLKLARGETSAFDLQVQPSLRLEQN